MRAPHWHILLLVSVFGCDRGPALDVPDPTPIDVPSAAGAALPHVDGALLSWVELAGSGHRLRYADLDGTAFSEARTVAEGENWFVNWADFPAVVHLPDGGLAAHWLQRSAPGTYAYDVMVSRSRDGSTWSAPVRPHTDGTPTEHGFVSMFPSADGVGIVWLDGRRFAGDSATNEMTVRYAVLGDSTGLHSEQIIDARACDCCQTAIAMTSAGPLLAYRDRSEREVRDIAVTRLVNGTWTEPRRVHADEWVIDACPVNGPQADARGDDVVIAWFTAARDTPAVHVALSGDAGETFGTPLRVDDGNPAGRVDVVMLDDERALVVWIERAAAGAEVRARIVTTDGTQGASRSIAGTTSQRSSGFPRIGVRDGRVLLGWTEPGDPSHVRAALLDFNTR